MLGINGSFPSIYLVQGGDGAIPEIRFKYILVFFFNMNDVKHGTVFFVFWHTTSGHEKESLDSFFVDLNYIFIRRLLPFGREAGRALRNRYRRLIFNAGNHYAIAEQLLRLSLSAKTTLPQ